MEKPAKKVVVAVSGGPDSVYLLLAMKSKCAEFVVAHLNHSRRGIASDEDQRFVEHLGTLWGFKAVSGKMSAAERSGRHRPGKSGDRGAAGSEALMRKARYRFLESVRRDFDADAILVAHTADDQVETVLMRILEGAGISGLKGIPRKGRDGIERPILEMWREDILKHLHRRKIPYRTDQSNFDTRFERNWVRHVLIPLLEKRYGKSVKKRIFALGERFRELDDLLENTSRKWLTKHVILDLVGSGEGAGRPARASARVPRRLYSGLPAAVRKKVLQLLCFERVGVAPNERLLESMDRMIVEGGPSAKLAIGKGATLSCRYAEAVLQPGPRERSAGAARRGGPGRAERRRPGRRAGAILSLHGPGRYPSTPEMGGQTGGAGDLFPWILWILWEEKGRVPAADARELAAGENAALFSLEDLLLPLAIRPLRPGDRIRPFGLHAEKKVKEVLIDRKVPREERWGRPVVCDAEGRILWIPGVVRSAHATVSLRSRRTVVLRAGPAGKA